MGREVNIDSIRALEEQIKEYGGTIIKLKRARNLLLNVSTLPPEVLGNVFRQNITRKGPFSGPEESSYSFLLVCHHWHEVASRTPELWTFWGNNFQDWDRRYLRSSVAIPFDLVLDGLTHILGNISKHQQTVLKERARRDTIRRVHLRSDMHGLLVSIISPLLSPSGGLQASSLESLILWSEDEVPLDVSFLAHSRLLKLQHLELSNCTVTSWDCLGSQTRLLTALDLSFNETSPTPTMSQLLSVLAFNPRLQRLRLRATALPADDDHGLPQVSLSHLEELRLHGDLRQVFGLLHRLKYHKNAALTLSLLHSQVADITQTIGPHLRDYLRRRGTPRKGLGLFISSGTLGSVVFTLGVPQEFSPSPSIEARMYAFVSINVELDQAQQSLLEGLTLDLIAHIPRDDVVYFRTCGNLAVVKNLRVQLPNLQTLDLLRLPLPAIFPRVDRHPSDMQEILPPSLQHIFMKQAFVGSLNWLPLVAYLTRRAASGNRLDSLLIDGPCHVCWSVTVKVKALVREFKIDRQFTRSWCPFGSCL